MEIRALSLWQPWAALMACGAKRIETRSWATSYRGWLAIHASKTWNAEIEEAAAGFREALTAGGYGFEPTRYRFTLPRGKILAVVKLIDCKDTSELAPEISEAEASMGNYEPQRFGWITADLRKIREPIEASGRQGLWDWTPPEWFVRQYMGERP